MHTAPIPKFLAHLKIDERGYPIPYFVAYVNGKPDFRMLDNTKMQLCVERKMCSVCGQKLFEYYYFITGPMGLASGTHSDPPMHKECAEYSITTCPHLHFEKAKMNERGEVYKQALVLNITGIREKPKELFLIKADKFKPIAVPAGIIIGFRKKSWIRYIYEKGILIKEENKTA